MPNIVLSENRCPVCGRRRIRRPDVGGDYIETVEGFVCQEYCNNDCSRNGMLYPLIKGRDPIFISNRGKKSFAAKIAGYYKLSFKDTKNLVKSIDTNNKNDFIKLFQSKIQHPVEVIKI
jgi:hypothetical protein